MFRRQAIVDTSDEDVVTEGNPQDDSVEAAESLSLNTSLLHDQQQQQQQHPEDDEDDVLLQRPLLLQSSESPRLDSAAAVSVPSNVSNPAGKTSLFRSRKTPYTWSGGTGAGGSSHAAAHKARRGRRKRRHRDHLYDPQHPSTGLPPSDYPTRSSRHAGSLSTCLQLCCRHRTVRNTLSCVNVLAKIVFWGTVLALAGASVWYSYELFNHGTDPHLIAWFSAGAFVLLGFPISMGGIVSHLSNYNQPHVQVYVVRILWMVPIYSVESWLAMRFHKHAIYIETLRDLYESYVLYSFLQFLIQVLGGEEALILLLKDKSPTRGVHMWGLQYCGLKPWLMGQPVRRSVIADTATTTSPHDNGAVRRSSRPEKRVHWTSPFFVKCKFGVLQYVLLKFFFSIAVMILERHGLYKEGNFTYKGGYLYICVLTNISQCWALYCLIFFYYATKNELAAIRPVGKFLSVKALVFFTWWQSVVIAILYKMNMIPHYSVGQDTNWTPEDVAKAIQDYLICMEMFLAAVVHTFVFPHSEYSPQAVHARTRALQHRSPYHLAGMKRLGRQNRQQALFQMDDGTSKSSGGGRHLRGSSADGRAMEMVTLDSNSLHTADHWDEYAHPSLSKVPTTSRASSIDTDEENVVGPPIPAWEEDLARPLAPVQDFDEEDGDEDENDDACSQSEGNDEDPDTTSGDDEDQLVQPPRPGFVRALLDSAIPRDLHHNTVGIVKGEYHVERKTLLHHATTSDQYDLFASHRRRPHSSSTSPTAAASVLAIVAPVEETTLPLRKDNTLGQDDAV